MGQNKKKAKNQHVTMRSGSSQVHNKQGWVEGGNYQGMPSKEVVNKKSKIGEEGGVKKGDSRGAKMGGKSFSKKQHERVAEV